MNAHFAQKPVASLLFALVLFPLLAACEVGGRDPGPESSAEDDAAASTEPTAPSAPRCATGCAGFADLLANDPLRHNYDFLRGDYGSAIQDHTVKNAGSHLDFSGYFAGEITMGIQGSERAALVDLGTEEEVAAKLGVEETVGSGQGFAHLALADGRFSFDEANAVLDAEPASLAHLQPQLGHVYLARITGRDEGGDLLVKMLVVYLEQSKEIALEWESLQR